MASFSPLQSRTPSAAGSLSLPLLPAEPRTDKWHPESRPQQLRTGLGARGVIYLFIYFYPRPSLLSCSGPFYLCGSSHICLRGLCKHGAQQILRCTVDSGRELFLLKRPSTPEEQEQREDKRRSIRQDGQSAASTSKKTSLLFSFFETSSFLTNVQQPRRSSNNNLSCVAAFCSSASTVWRCRRLLLLLLSQREQAEGGDALLTPPSRHFH